MTLLELKRMIEELNIKMDAKIKNMKETSKQFLIDEWILTFTGSTTLIKIDADEIDSISAPYYEFEVASYSLVEKVELMESYYNKKETVLRNVRCIVEITLQSE